MSCNFSRDMDFMDYLVAPRDDRWNAFRMHYPQCAACSATLSKISAMDDDLKRVLDPSLDGKGNLSPSEHPSPSLLFALLEGTLPSSQLATIRHHVDACADCRAELSAVQTSEALLAEPAVDRSRDAEEATAGSWLDRLSGWLVMTPRSVSVLALLLITAASSFFVLRSPSTTGDSPPRLVEVPSDERRQEHSPSPSPLRPAIEGTERGLAIRGADEGDVQPGSLESDPTHVPPSALPTSNSTPTHIASVEAEPREAAGGDPAPPADPRDAERETILLAALDPTMIPGGDPVYREWAGGPLPFGAAPRIVRNIGPNPNAASTRPAAEVLAPRDAFGLTRSSQPTLYWVLDRRSRRGIELTITSIDAVEPIFARVLPTPIEAGLHTLSLEEENVHLEIGGAYHWEVAIVEDPLRRDRDRISSANIGVVALPEIDEQLAEQPSEAAVHVLAMNGIWLDAFERNETMLTQLPDSDRPIRNRRALLESAGHGEIGGWLAKRAATE